MWVFIWKFELKTINFLRKMKNKSKSYGDIIISIQNSLKEKYL